MQKTITALAVTAIFGFSPLQAAGFKGRISFTSAEKTQHLYDMPKLGHHTKSCMFNAINKHRSWLKKHRVSAYYGSVSKFGKLKTLKQKQGHLRNMSVDPRLASQMEGTSCVGFVLRCLGEGFEKSGQAGLWKRVRNFVSANLTTGDSLLHALQALGWKISYWNPDPSKNRSWDSNENISDIFASGTFKGYHQHRYNNVMRKGRYYRNYVDDRSSLVGFKTQIPAKVKRAPFFVGISHTGYHVFAGGTIGYQGGQTKSGMIMEAHSSMSIKNKRALEIRTFNPFKKWKYKSGLFAFPPTR